MVWYSFIFLVVLLQQTNCEFSPTLNVSCFAGPVYEFTISNQSTLGAILIEGHCVQQETDNENGTYRFDNSVCKNDLPALETTITVYLFEYSGLLLSNDKVYDVTCNITTDEILIELLTGVEISKKEETIEKLTVVKPDLTVTTGVEGSEAGVGNVGDKASIDITMSEDDAELFDIFIVYVFYSDGVMAMPIIENGCTMFEDIVESPEVVQDGRKLIIDFQLFLFLDTTDDTPMVKPTNVTFTIGLEICPERCLEVNCSMPFFRRRRSVENDNSTVQTVEHSTTLTVYPAGYPRAEREEIKDSRSYKRDVDNDLCLDRASFYGLICGLLFVLLVCVGISACMFYCLKKRLIYKGRDTSYMNKAFN